MMNFRFLGPCLGAILAVLLVHNAAVHAQVYTQNFNGFADGTTNLGDGSAIFGTNLGAANGAGVQGGALQLTNDGVGSGYGIYQIPALTGSSMGWTASFDFTLSDAVGGNPPADGFSFTYGAIPAGDPGYRNFEEGYAPLPATSFNHFSVEFDTWNVADAEHGYNVSVNSGQAGADPFFANTTFITDGATLNGTAVITYDPTDGVSLDVDTGSGLMSIVANADVGALGFTPDDTHRFAFAGRTGGATETLLLDNVNISTAAVPEPASVAIWSLIGAACACFGYSRYRRK